MSTLSDRDILKHLQFGWQLAIEPFDARQLQPASYDVRLGSTFQVPCNVAYGERVSIDRAAGLFPRMKAETLGWQEDAGIRRRKDAFVLNPGCFVLGTTVERLRLGKNLIAKLDGKSTLGRLGLIVHCTAGYIDPGFEGQITLEMFNCAPYPIELVPGAPIGQLRFEFLSSPCLRAYGSAGLGSHYQGQTGATPPKL